MSRVAHQFVLDKEWYPSVTFPFQRPPKIVLAGNHTFEKSLYITLLCMFTTLYNKLGSELKSIVLLVKFTLKIKNQILCLSDPNYISK